MTSVNREHRKPTEQNRIYQLPALTGVRFLLILHIFFYHLWAVYDYLSGKTEATQGLFIGFDHAPELLLVFISNGWVSTSLFFLLSGFILAYLYWGEDGQLTISKRRFWTLRCARIYPIHLVVLIILIILKLPNYLVENISSDLLISSALGTSALVQAWVPAWIPLWSWPTWTISVMLFLYLMMPYTVKILSRLTQQQLIFTLIAMPFISLIPSVAYASMMAAGIPWSMNTELFFSNFPIFWLPYFVAGMLTARIFSLNRSRGITQSPSIFCWGDAAFIVAMGIACLPELESLTRHFIRQGVLMPLYIVFILDLARGKGMMAKIFSLPGMAFLGETGFSIFIWQSLVVVLAIVSLSYFPSIGPYQVWLALLFILALAIASTYLIEKPIVRLIRSKLNP